MLNRDLPENDLRAAWTALKNLLADPEDTSQAFALLESLPGPYYRVLQHRFFGSAEGRALLAERPDLLATLRDREALRALPEDSLGAAYLAFVEREEISADGLVAAGEGSMPEDVDPDWLYVEERLRDQHDLWHTVLGYSGDVVGEGAVLGFSLAQTGNLGMLLLVVAALLKQGPFAGLEGSSRVILHAFVRGLRAAWFPTQRWEELLSRPLVEVREALGVGAPPAYRRAYTDARRHLSEAAAPTRSSVTSAPA